MTRRPSTDDASAAASPAATAPPWPFAPTPRPTTTTVLAFAPPGRRCGPLPPPRVPKVAATAGGPRLSARRGSLAAAAMLATALAAAAGAVPSRAAAQPAAGTTAPAAGVSLPPSSAPSGAVPGGGPAAMAGQIESIQLVPGGQFSAVKLQGRGELYLLSANGRFAVRGPVYDLWQGRDLGTVDEIREAAQTVSLSGLRVVMDELDPATVGTGPDEVVVFVDPNCPYCRALVEQARALDRAEPGRWRFTFLAFPLLGPQSGAVVRNLQCAQDREAARAALLDHARPANARPLPERPDCDLAPAQRRLVLARMLGVEGVPYTIRPDGRVVQGLPPDFAAWLRASGPRLAAAATAGAAPGSPR